MIRPRLLLYWYVAIFISLFTNSLAYAEERYPERIISLGPSITKALYLLGVEDKLIANTVYCLSPPEAKNKEKIGTVVEVNIERVFRLNPDLVIATSLISPKTKEKLKNLGIKLATFPTPGNFSQMCKQFLELGKLVGKVKVAEEIVKSAAAKADSIKENVKNLPHPKVLVQIGARPLFVATGSYFINDYIEFAGGINIAKDAKEGIYSREQILKADPEVIIITKMGIATEKEKEVWQKYKTLSAVKSGRIYIIDTDEITSPTPASFVKTLEEIVYILHAGE